MTSTFVAIRPLVVISLLADSATRSAATREFAGHSVLARTVSRARNAPSSPEVVVLAWEDQVVAAKKALPDETATVRSCGPRKPTPQMNAASASLRWADGWRGGLMGVSSFDRGFDAKPILAALEAFGCDAAVLLDPNAALIDSSAIESLIQHAAERPTIDYAFQPGTPGSGAMLLRIDSLRELLRTQKLPGNLLAYHPDRPIHDPIAKEVAVVVSPRVARSLTRTMIDSERQTRRLSLKQVDACDTEQLVEQLQNESSLDPMPRELVIELTTERVTRPIFSIFASRQVPRQPMSLAQARRLFVQVGKIDDLRVTFAGVGDPLLHPDFEAILSSAREAGIEALHVETDLVSARSQAIEFLASGKVDVVSVHLPAAHRDTYQCMMGCDRIQEVLDNVKRLVQVRAQAGSGLPIVVPLFTKCEANLGEMEEWYDQWIRAVGAAVVRGPSDFGGAIDYVGVSDMCPPVRKPCRRLSSRMTILSDGMIASCEEDVLGRQSCGHIGQDTIEHAWQETMQGLRMSAGVGAVCSKCRMWDRP